MGEHSLRLARIPADSAGIADVYLSSARHHAQLAPEWYRVPEATHVVERFERALSGTETIIVGEYHGEVVGFVQVQILPPGSPHSMLQQIKTAALELAVAADHRGAGLGTALLRAGEHWSASRGVQRLQLDGLAANSSALRLYRQRFGYRDFGVILHKRVDEVLARTARGT
jgi:ribosomal protein S18 acetylase RimI-like enzyme